MNTNGMHWHSQLCKPSLASIDDDDNDWEEESVDNENGREFDEEFAFYKD